MSYKEIEFDFFKLKNNKKNNEPLFLKFLVYFSLTIHFAILFTICVFIFKTYYIPSEPKNNLQIQQMMPQVQASQEKTAQLAIQQMMTTQKNVSYLLSNNQTNQLLTSQQKKQIQEISHQANNIIQNLKNINH